MREWVEDWYCYWDGRDAYVFDPPLRVAPSGLVTAGSERGCEGRECVATALLAARRNQAGTGALPQLPALAWALILKDAVASARHWAALDGAERAVLQMVGARPIGLGDESDYCWEPFVCSWGVEDGALTPVSLLQRVGAHVRLVDGDKGDVFDEDRFGGDVVDEEDCFDGELMSYLVQFEERVGFSTGTDLLNPVVVFAVAKVAPTVVAGFVGGIIHT